MVTLSTLVLAAALAASPESGAPTEPREIAWPGEEGGIVPDAAGGIAIERCDGTRTQVRSDPGRVCTRWKIEWSVGGKVWGTSAATSLAAVTSERERLLGYARQSARLFDAPLDPRWSAPTSPLCDACDPLGAASSTAGPAGGPPAAAADEATQTAWLDARVALSRFETNVLDVHAGRIREIARLAHEPATARLAKAYAKQLDAAVIDAVQLQLQLDNAVVFRSVPQIARVQQALEARAKQLDAAAVALAAVVAKAVARQHAGRYADDASTDVNRPQLVIAFNVDKVTATLVVGEAESQWFEGTVALDGSIAGRSLVAPEGASLTCNAHSIECGYVWAPAMLRFADRDAPRGKQHLVELWFQQSKWVHAKPFSR